MEEIRSRWDELWEDLDYTKPVIVFDVPRGGPWVSREFWLHEMNKDWDATLRENALNLGSSVPIGRRTRSRCNYSPEMVKKYIEAANRTGYRRFLKELDATPVLRRPFEPGEAPAPNMKPLKSCLRGSTKVQWVPDEKGPDPYSFLYLEEGEEEQTKVVSVEKPPSEKREGIFEFLRKKEESLYSKLKSGVSWLLGR